MSKSPLALVKEKFGDKDKLVAALEPLAKDEGLWVDRVNADKGLSHVSNTKLLRLHAVLTEVKQRFGSRAKLIDAICEVEKRTKDQGFRKRLEKYPAPRLLDAYKSAAKRAGVSTKGEAKAAPAKKSPAAKAAPAKKAAPKKTAG
jgi:hypothetical protein